LLQARNIRGLDTLLLITEEGDRRLGIPPVDPLDAEAVRQQILDLAHQHQTQLDQSLESLLIIGGSDVVPLAACRLPLAEQADTVHCDDAYGLVEADQLLTSWPVARLPGATHDPGLLTSLLGMAAHYQRHPPPLPSRSFGYTAAAWQTTAATVYQVLPGRMPLQVAPPTSASTLNAALLNGVDRVYINLHGFPEGPFWYGQAAHDTPRAVALRPADLDTVRFNGATILSEACFGANLLTYEPERGFPLRFLQRGAACFAGFTATAYGPVTLPLADADLLAAHFLRASLIPGISAGGAYQLSRQMMLREVVQQQGFVDEDTLSTLSQFVLYGDPTIIIGGPAATLNITYVYDSWIALQN
jgi:hypothetical protein